MFSNGSKIIMSIEDKTNSKNLSMMHFSFLVKKKLESRMCVPSSLSLKEKAKPGQAKPSQAKGVRGAVDY